MHVSTYTSSDMLNTGTVSVSRRISQRQYGSSWSSRAIELIFLALMAAQTLEQSQYPRALTLKGWQYGGSRMVAGSGSGSAQMLMQSILLPPQLYLLPPTRLTLITVPTISLSSSDGDFIKLWNYFCDANLAHYQAQTNSFMAAGLIGEGVALGGASATLVILQLTLLPRFLPLVVPFSLILPWLVFLFLVTEVA